MLWALRELGTPLRYLRITIGDSLLQSKVVYDWVLPVLLAALSVVLIAWAAPSATILTDQGLVGGFQKLLELLVPFFIAALAAVATFERQGLDEEMKGAPAILKVGYDEFKEPVYVKLTRRQFICYLFGYLAFLSLMLFLVILFLNLFRDVLTVAFGKALGEQVIYGRSAALFLLLVPIWQLIVTTLLGIYFLCDRMQVMDDLHR